MKRLMSTLLALECKHRDTIVVRSVGVERTVCERCGHLSFVIGTPTAVGRVTPKSRPKLLSRASGL